MIFFILIFLYLTAAVSCASLEPHLGSWSEWGPCSASCGSGTASRKTAWVVNGYSTDYIFYDTVECSSSVICPIDGHWSMWSEWSVCPVMCGTGYHTRERWCDSPAPKHGGRSCLGQRQGEKKCNEIKCPEIPKNFKLSSCNSSHYMCHSQKYCVIHRVRCDRKLHCDDGSDEKDCHDSFGDFKGGTIRLQISSFLIPLSIMTIYSSTFC